MQDEHRAAIRIVRAALLASLASATVAACAGGGGGGGGPVLPPPIAPPPPPPPPSPPPPSPPAQPASFYESREYLGQLFTSSPDLDTSTELTRASSAYAAGATGQGIVVAVIDTDVDDSISELAGRIAGTHDVCATAISSCGSGRAATDIDTDGHGSMVASVIAANKNNTGMHGIAFQAQVLAIRADTPGNCQRTGPDENCSFNDTNLIRAINYAVANGARIINMSLGGEGNISTSLRNAIVSATNQGVLFTIAAGNDGVAPTGTAAAEGTQPSEPAIIAGDPAVNGRVVAVGAVNSSGVMATFSNRAGSTANYYLLAPGVSIVTAGVDDNVRLPGGASCSTEVTTACNDLDDDGDYWRASGTSFSAPAVAGALALMLDLFPNITPQNALAALLSTADDYVTTTPDAILGINAAAGTDTVGGRGVMNLARAFAPIGTTTLNFDGEQVEVAQALGPASGALGDWMEASGAFDGLVFQDIYERGFQIDTTRMSAGRATFGDFGVRADYARGQARAVRLGEAQLSWFNAPKPAYDPRIPWQEAPDPTFQLSYSFGATQVSVGRGGGAERLTPGLSLVEDPSGPPMLGSGDSWTSVSHAVGPLTFDARTSEGSGRSASAIGFGAQGETGTGDAWAMRVGYASLRDANTALGGALQSRFGGEDQTRMSAVSFEASRDVGSWMFSGVVEAAAVQIERLDVSGLWTSSWSVSAQHPFAGGALRFTAGQPRRSEGGELSFRAPVELTRAGQLIFSDRTAGLTPSGRELDIEAAWSTRLGEMTTLELATALATQPSHVADAENETAVWIGLRRAW
jgi:subtilisin family serine protease